MNFCADLFLRNREHIVVVSPAPGAHNLSEMEAESVRTRRFPLKNGEITVDLYHINAPAGAASRFSFSVSSTDSPPAANQLKVFLNDKPLDSSGAATVASVWTQTIELDSGAMQHQLVIKIRAEDPTVPAAQWFFEAIGLDTHLVSEGWPPITGCQQNACRIVRRRFRDPAP